MKSLEYYIENAIRVKNVLTNSEHYLAHLPASQAATLKVETLAEHLELVFKYLLRLGKENELDKIINGLIQNILKDFSSDNKPTLADYIKQLFTDTVIFHDFGKVNENFQTDRMRNSLFKNVSTIIKPAHGHSELGAFIYLSYHLDCITKLSILNDDEKNFIAFCAFVLVNSINLHHSPEITEPVQRLERSVFVKQYGPLIKYLALYKIQLSELAIAYFDNLKDAIDSVELNTTQYFPLYALSKLNFSLLTASDYLATSEYMNQQEVTDLGVIDKLLRDKIIIAAHHSQVYNTKAYEIAETKEEIRNPTERSTENLNILRQNMSVEVIRNIRKNGTEHLFYLEAPTGGGKTNLSMLATAELLEVNKEINKIFYVYPFTTLITQTHKAILKTLNLTEREVSLLHSKAGFQSSEDDLYGDQKVDYLNNLFVHYPFCLLTHIRFFDILKTNEKETNYLLHRLANSIVVIDEVQSYAPKHWDKMLYFIQQYATAFNVRFILMSATLPRIDKLKLPIANQIEFIDLLPAAKNYFTNTNFSDRVQFRFDYRDQELEISELSEIVLKKSEEYAVLSETKSVYTIVEFIFKKSATEFNEAINERFFNEVFVLSGTVLEPRRREIINYLKNKNNRSKNVLLITTQVVEAGVDIDMDLGFKNVSLIDSDEQLAGRVNRNVTKKLCEVYLFKVNEPSQLYKQDDRYIVTRDGISKEEHAEILRDKNFERLYDLVLSRIDKLSSFKELQNFNSNYLTEIQRLNYSQVHKKFQLIDQENLSVFVPLNLSKQVLSSEGDQEAIFSKQELIFLSKLGVNVDYEFINGIEVWRAYKSMYNNKKEDFTEQQIDKKIMAGILSKFTFSIFASHAIKLKLKAFSIPSDDKEENLRGFDNYIYLAHHEKCYDYKKGLIEAQFEASENYIL